MKIFLVLIGCCKLKNISKMLQEKQSIPTFSNSRFPLSI